MTIVNVGSMRLEVSDWISGSAAPVREGVYERRGVDGAYSCWNGDRWGGDADAPDEAAASRAVSREQAAPWRGLAAPSDAPCATCRGHTVVDAGVDADAGTDLLGECPDC